MKRPYKLRHVPTGHTRAFGSADAAFLRVAFIPASIRDDWLFIDDDGKSYSVGPIIETMRTIASIYDIARRLVAAT